jgi:hypothetical protein
MTRFAATRFAPLLSALAGIAPVASARMVSARAVVASAAVALALAAAPSAQAQSFCVYDPVGAAGDYYSLAKDYQLAAKRWGVDVELRLYTDDSKLDTAFKAGDCDMASMIGMRARQYNLFTGTLDAPSVLENYAEVRDVMALMASPKLAKVMVSGNYEVVGLLPLGSAYAIVNDRSINTFAHAAGKRVAVLGWDKTQALMAQQFDAVPVPTDVLQIGHVFRQHEVDVVVSPLQLFKAEELEKGMGKTGGVVRRPLFQLSMQLVARNGSFPPGFGQTSREYMNRQTDHALSIVHNQEAAMDSHNWVFASVSEVATWNSTMRTFNDRMASAGNFDRRMLKLLKQVRCQNGAEEGGCSGAPADLTELSLR